MRCVSRFDGFDGGLPGARALDDLRPPPRHRPASAHVPLLPRSLGLAKPCALITARPASAGWTKRRHHFEIIFGHEIADGQFPLDQHGQRGSLHAPHGKLFVHRPASRRARDSCPPASRRGCGRARHRPADRSRCPGVRASKPLRMASGRERGNPQPAERLCGIRRPRRCSGRSARLRGRRRWRTPRCETRGELRILRTTSNWSLVFS